MAAISLEAMQQDRLVMSVARALSLANEAAIGQGTGPVKSLVTISEESTPAGRQWRINYGPRDYINHRGGDLSIVVDEQTAGVQQIVRGQ